MQLRNPDAPARRRTDRTADAVAAGLGWLSIGLGLAELLAPKAMARCLGSPEGAGISRAYGLREIATGIGILRSPDPRPWLWGRVAGDLLDLATLSLGLGRDNPRRPHVGVAISSVAVITLVDLLCARTLDEADRGPYVAPDYSGRSGFPKPPSKMRGIAARGRSEE